MADTIIIVECVPCYQISDGWPSNIVLQYDLLLIQG